MSIGMLCSEKCRIIHHHRFYNIERFYCSRNALEAFDLVMHRLVIIVGVSVSTFRS